MPALRSISKKSQSSEHPYPATITRTDHGKKRSAGSRKSKSIEIIVLSSDDESSTKVAGPSRKPDVGTFHRRKPSTIHLPSDDILELSSSDESTSKIKREELQKENKKLRDVYSSLDVKTPVL